LKAYVFHGQGRAGLEELAAPQPGPGEVRLRVAATALNHLDVFARTGIGGPGIRQHHYPHVSGVDVAGVVDVAGADIEDPRPGTAVVVYAGMSCGRCELCHRGETSMCRDYRIVGEQTWGGLAEYTVVPAANVLALPQGFDLRTAAAAPAAFTTAWRLLVTAGEIRPGDRVLVVGAGGGVASAALLIAAAAGALVYATSGSGWKLERALALGAMAAVNHSERGFDEWAMEVTGGRGMDLVVDSVGAASWRRSIRSLAPGGRLCVCGATSGDTPDISIRELYQSHRRILGSPMGGRKDFDEVMALVLQGRLKPVIHAVYPLEQTGDALDELEAGRQFGKIVIEPGARGGGR
jgi:NADPH:quinone reductase-like Zn-dependent oxidoreductase